MDAEQVLREAAGYVEKGWIRGKMYDSYGRVCALGALYKGLEVPRGMTGASYDTCTWSEVVCALADVMVSQFGIDMAKMPSQDPQYLIAFTNDGLAKNRKEIIACMEKAAANVQEQSARS